MNELIEFIYNLIFMNRNSQFSFTFNPYSLIVDIQAYIY